MPSTFHAFPFGAYSNDIGSGNHIRADDISSPLDENASDSIASTLASLGLNDNHYYEPITRNRAYTVAADHLSPSFLPFPSTMKRPRATSLNRPQSTESLFSPFDMSYQHTLSEGSTTILPSRQRIEEVSDNKKLHSWMLTNASFIENAF